MLFQVRMDVEIPADLPADVANDIKAREKAYSQQLQRSGKWRHIWRVVGEYANYSIFDVDSNEELHEILTGLPQRSEEHTSELQSLMRHSYAVFCLKKTA